MSDLCELVNLDLKAIDQRLQGTISGVSWDVPCPVEITGYFSP